MRLTGKKMPAKRRFLVGPGGGASRVRTRPISDLLRRDAWSAPVFRGSMTMMRRERNILGKWTGTAEPWLAGANRELAKADSGLRLEPSILIEIRKRHAC